MNCASISKVIKKTHQESTVTSIKEKRKKKENRFKHQVLQCEHSISVVDQMYIQSAWKQTRSKRHNSAPVKAEPAITMFRASSP